jgi:hypothetical protein
MRGLCMKHARITCVRGNEFALCGGIAYLET